MISTSDLGRRIAEERMHEIQPHGDVPDWVWQFDIDQPRVWTLNRDGQVSRTWQWLDAVSWHDVVAIRMEYSNGQALDPADLHENDMEWFGEG